MFKVVRSSKFIEMDSEIEVISDCLVSFLLFFTLQSNI